MPPLPQQHLLAIPAGGIAHGGTVCLEPAEPCRLACSPGLGRICRSLAGTGRDRCAHHLAARRHHPATDLGRPDRSRDGLDTGQPARCAVGCRSRLPLPVAGVLGLSPGHRQGGDGPWRLQTAGRAGRLVWLAPTPGPAADRLGIGPAGRAGAAVAQAAAREPADRLWPFSGAGRRLVDVFRGTGPMEALPPCIPTASGASA